MKLAPILLVLGTLLPFAIPPMLLAGTTRSILISEGWAKNSVNAIVFRRNSIVSHKGIQYAAFYDSEGTVVLAKRVLTTSVWELEKTPYKGVVHDAHRSISIMVDGNGYLHMSWNHHNSPLNYCRSVAPGGLEMGPPTSMTGANEHNVTYPEFHRMPNGNILFLYRTGGSGNGDLIMNHYDTGKGLWTRRQIGLVSGEGQRNAYWQMAIDARGAIHLSWVWRESGDVASNHDLAYARSRDEGLTWEKTTGEIYSLPITIATAEYAERIAQNRELINQTSICADSRGRPYIATYWRDEDSIVPQYRLVYHDGSQWRTSTITQRQTPFTLSGGGTKRIPISRPQIVADDEKLYVVYRDIERGEKVTLAICDNLNEGIWRMEDLTDTTVGQWEPSYDTERWRTNKELHLFVQRVGQGDEETTEDLPPQTISIIEWTPQ